MGYYELADVVEIFQSPVPGYGMWKLQSGRHNHQIDIQRYVILCVHFVFHTMDTLTKYTKYNTTTQTKPD